MVVLDYEIKGTTISVTPVSRIPVDVACRNRSLAATGASPLVVASDARGAGT